jgi:hypothetical protein
MLKLIVTAFAGGMIGACIGMFYMRVLFQCFQSTVMQIGSQRDDFPVYCRLVQFEVSYWQGSIFPGLCSRCLSKILFLVKHAKVLHAQK